MNWRNHVGISVYFAGQRHASANHNPKRQRGNLNPKHQRANHNPKHQRANHLQGIAHVHVELALGEKKMSEPLYAKHPTGWFPVKGIGPLFSAGHLCSARSLASDGRSDGTGDIQLGRRPSRTRRVNPRNVRQAFTMVEAVVAAGLLLVVMSFVTSLAYKIDLVWQDTRHRLTAINELSNPLERLTLLSPEELPAALGSLEASELAARTLPDPELTSEIINDPWGKRLVLRLNWQRRHVARPVELVAWLPPEDSTETSQGDSAE